MWGLASCKCNLTFIGLNTLVLSTCHLILQAYHSASKNYKNIDSITNKVHNL